MTTTTALPDRLRDFLRRLSGIDPRRYDGNSYHSCLLGTFRDQIARSVGISLSTIGDVPDIYAQYYDVPYTLMRAIYQGATHWGVDLDGSLAMARAACELAVEVYGQDPEWEGKPVAGKQTLLDLEFLGRFMVLNKDLLVKRGHLEEDDVLVW